MKRLKVLIDGSIWSVCFVAKENKTKSENLQQNFSRFVRNKEFNEFKISNQNDNNNANNNLGATWRKLLSNKFQSNIIQSFWELQIFSDRFPYAWPQTIDQGVRRCEISGQFLRIRRA